MKMCTICLEQKTDSDFSIKRRTKSGEIRLRESCRLCRAKSDELYYQTHQNDIKARVKNYEQTNKELIGNKNLAKHGITREQFNILLSKFGGMCWSCKNRPAKHIDHDHTCCNKSHSCGSCIRGILCHQCNVGLGMFSDSIEGLQSAIEYLNTYSNKSRKE